MLKKNIIEYFEETLASEPDKVAIIDGERRVTFADLGIQAKQAALMIRKKTNGAMKRPIAVYLEKSVESFGADIGIIYSGNAYMNIDNKLPVQRIENIFRLVDPACVITDSKHYRKISDIWPREQTLIWDTDLAIAATEDAEVLYQILEKMIDTDPLCLINTSGSTGTPKSVVLNHKSFIDYTQWAIHTIGIRQDEILGSLAPIAFDHSSYELCLMLSHSCTLLIVPESYTMFPAKLLQIMAEEKVSYIFWVPTIMVNIANMDLLSRIELPTLRMIWFAGEVFPTRQFNYWRAHLPDATFVNLYGPTEITVDCTYYIVDRELRDDEPIPIGGPCRNTDVLVLNDAGKPAKGSEEGELCVRGTSLAMGYYNNPEKTAAVFVQNPLNTAYPELIYRTGDIVYRNERGELIFKGRNDSLIKHQGKRIELAEIEHVIINMLQLVKNGCAVYDTANKEIVFFCETETELPVGKLRREIAEALPNYMVPSRFIFMPELPRNINGKIDRLKLKQSV